MIRNFSKFFLDKGKRICSKQINPALQECNRVDNGITPQARSHVAKLAGFFHIPLSGKLIRSCVMRKPSRLYYVFAKSDLGNVMEKGIRHTLDSECRGRIVLVDWEGIDARACWLLHCRKRMVETYSVLEVFHRAYNDMIRYSESGGIWLCDCQIGVNMFKHVDDRTVECVKSGSIVHLFPAC